MRASFFGSPINTGTNTAKAVNTISIDHRLGINFHDINKKDQILSFLDTKIKDSEQIRIKNLEQKYENDMKVLRNEMNNQFNHILSIIQQNPKLSYIKSKVLDKFV